MIRILAVDDETLALENLVDCIESVLPEAEVQAFQNPLEAIAYAKEHAFQTAFLDIRMTETDGLQLAEQLQETNPKINIIFTTGFSDYASDAFALHASGYVKKPVTEEKIEKELQHLRNPHHIDQIPTEGFYAKCFGNFEAYYNAEPLQFKYKKSQELLAYLIDRNGSLSTNAEIAAILWEDDDNDHTEYLKKIKSDLNKVMKSIGCEDLLAKVPRRIGVKPDAINCDYYQYLSNPEEYKDTFNGEYMSQYSWSEYTAGTLLLD